MFFKRQSAKKAELPESVAICYRCQHVVKKSSMAEVQLNVFFSRPSTSLYCTICAPPYDKIAVDWQGNSRFYKSIEVDFKGNPIKAEEKTE